jgi:PAS domain S-box-containing protein
MRTAGPPDHYGHDGLARAGSAGSERRGALEQSEQRFRLLVESVVDYAIFLLDTDGTVVSWNAGAERLKGYREVEIVGQHYSVFYPEEDRDELPAKLLAEAEVEGRSQHTGWRIRRDGSRFWADVVITALRDPDGELTGFAKVTRDMTTAHETEQAREQAVVDQQRALERLEELERWRRDFLSSVIHDLQSPIFVIQGFIELLRADRIPEERRRELAERVLSNTRSLQDLIDNLRDYSRLNEPRVTLHREPIDLSAFLADLLADLEPMLDGRPVELVVEGPEGEGDLQVPADRHGLERVLRNLVVNAVRHTPSGTLIRLRAWAEDHTVAIEVEDEGEGIPEELLPRLFERFVAGSGGGTGLGLSIAKRFVELHGGDLEARSSPGEGTIFRVVLPRAAATPPA